MTALAADRPLIKRHYGDRNFPVAGSVCLWENAMVALTTGGLLRPAGLAATDIVVGVSKRRYDNRAGLANAISAEVESDSVRAMFNSAGGDAITLMDIGKACYAVDDQTVALTDATGTRAKAGIIHNVTEAGVWVRFTQ